jgi:hypothetical protein
MMDRYKSELPTNIGTTTPKTSRLVTANIDDLLSRSNIKLQSTDDVMGLIKKSLTPGLVHGTIEGGVESTLRGSESLLGHGSSGIGKLVLTGVALGLAGVMVGQMSAKPGPLQPEHRNKGKGEAPATDGSYEEPQVAYKGKAPMQKQMYSEAGNKGMHIRVNAKNSGQMSNDQVANTINSTVQESLPSRMNVNVVSRDDTQKVDDGWLETQFKRLLG